MATFVMAPDFLEAVHEKVHNLASDTLRIALSNTAPGSESSNPMTSGNGVLANITQISYANYSDDMGTDRALEGVVSNESGGTYSLVADDIIITASGGALPTFRYVYIYNDTAAGDPIIGYADHGSGLTLAEHNMVTLPFSDGIFTAAEAA